MAICSFLYRGDEEVLQRDAYMPIAAMAAAVTMVQPERHADSGEPRSAASRRLARVSMMLLDFHRGHLEDDGPGDQEVRLVVVIDACRGS